MFVSLLQVQTEADESAFGSREDKLIGARLQRKAWDCNAELLTPLFTKIRPPLPRHRRKRGQNGAAWAVQQHTHLQRRDQRIETDSTLDAKEAIMAAAVSKIPAASAAALV